MDDLTTTAGTITSAARLCKDRKGPSAIYAAVSHAVLTDMAVERLRDSEIVELITTNSVPP